MGQDPGSEPQPRPQRSARRADLTTVLDACYAPARDHDAWSRDLVGAVSESFPWLSNIGLIAIRHDADLGNLSPIAAVAPRGVNLSDALQVAISAGRDAVRRFFYPRGLIALHSELERGADAHVRGWMRSYRSSLETDELIGMVVHPGPGIALSVFGALERGRVVTRHDRLRLGQIALHLESGFRMRSTAGRVVAVLTATGEMLDGDVSPARRGQLARSARGAELARSSRDLDPWTALVAGEVSVVPRLRGARRVYEIVENAPAARPFRALSRREVDVLAIAARGVPAKLCAYALGLSPATISTVLASAAVKIGVTSRIELVRVASLLACDPRVDADDAALTRAEREILALVREGLSNTEIGRRRGRSVRTIANQVAALLAKTKSPSRRALAASR